MREAAGEVVYITPVRQEEYTEPRYKHMWQGWLEFGRSELPEPIALGLRLLGRWPLPEDRSWVRLGRRLRGLHVTETLWDSNGEDDWSWEETRFCGWDELLHPVNKRYRDVEEQLPVPAGVEAKFLKGLRLVGNISWIARPLREGEQPIPGTAYGLTPGTYHKIRVRNADGELLWEASMVGSHCVDSDNTLTMTDVGVDLSW